ncbi:MAG: hypothetical protein K5907_00645 [Treponema sp.]|nr:hypothetical protein [Treponema sp.]
MIDSLDNKTRFYCIWVRTGQEEDFIKDIEKILNDDALPLKGKLYFLKKDMRLKNGKEYQDPFFSGYVFFETQNPEDDFTFLKKGRGYIRILPKKDEIQSLNTCDLGIVKSIISFGSTIPIVHVNFDENDRIKLLDGPFKNMSGKVTSVNRRNHRVNLSMEFMNGIKMVGLTYEEVEKMED